MGIIRQGILGGFRNKTGSVVGAYWRKLDVIRGLPRKSGKPPTQLQLNQQNKFRMITSYLSWISGLIEVGFKSVSDVATPMNMAVAYHLKEAITGIAPNFTIDYTKVRFSAGRLEMAYDVAVEASAAARVDYTWVHTGPDDKYIDATDKVTVLVYNPAKDKFVSLRNAAARSVETFNLNVPAEFTGDLVHCYISFNSVKTKLLVSDSLYLGTVTVI